MKKFMPTAALCAAIAFSATSALASNLYYATYTSGANVSNLAYTVDQSGPAKIANLDTVVKIGSSFVNGGVPVQFGFATTNYTFNAEVGIANALFTFSATSTQTANSAGGGSEVNQVLTYGSFSYISTSTIVARGLTHSAGSNLLSGVFTNAFITGFNHGSLASLTANDALGTLDLSSDFVSFSPATSEGVAFDLGLISGGLTRKNYGTVLHPYYLLTPFHARTATGSFDSNRSPIPIGLPEPTAWGMMLVGFGGLGALARRRRAVAA